MYILLPLVLILWGYIIYRIAGQASCEVDLPCGKLPLLQINSDQNEKKSYRLILDYKDPFLKTVFAVNNNIGGEQAENHVKGRRLHIWNWPNFNYSGCIQNPQKVIGILRINDSDLLVQEGEVYEEYRVYKLLPDSIIMEREGEKRTIVKSFNTN